MKKYILLFVAVLMAAFLSACGVEKPDTVSYVLEAVSYTHLTLPTILLV